MRLVSKVGMGSVIALGSIALAAPFPVGSQLTVLQQVAPFQAWPALGNQTTGVLVMKDFAGFCNINHTQFVAQQPDFNHCYVPNAEQNTYVYAIDGKSPFAVYFKSSGEGFNFLKDWKMTNGFVADAAAFNKDTPNRWGLSRSAHLVRLEVNGGLGTGADSIHFVVTDAQVLDGTAAFPLDVEKLLHQALDPYGNSKNAPVKEADTKLRAGVETTETADPGYAALKDTTNGRSSRFYAGFAATWLAESQVLRVTYYRRYEDSYWRMITSTPLPGPIHRPPPHPLTYTTTYGSEFAHNVSFDREGKIVAEQDLTGNYKKSPKAR